MHTWPWNTVVAAGGHIHLSHVLHSMRTPHTALVWKTFIYFTLKTQCRINYFTLKTQCRINWWWQLSAMGHLLHRQSAFSYVVMLITNESVNPSWSPPHLPPHPHKCRSFHINQSNPMPDNDTDANTIRIIPYYFLLNFAMTGRPHKYCREKLTAL